MTIEPVHYWRVPRMWGGETVVILGGGPSLTLDDVERVRVAREAGGVRAIAINNSYRIAPWADVLYFADMRYWGWHEHEPAFRNFAGQKITVENRQLAERHREIKIVRNAGPDGLELDPTAVRTGANSCYQAANIAFHAGAARILFLGLDMQPVAGRSHWHEGHPTRTDPLVYRVMIDAFGTLAPELARRGVEAINCTPGSALAAFPIRPLSEVLIDANRLRPDPTATALPA
jgi:hypothetical protein